MIQTPAAWQDSTRSPSLAEETSPFTVRSIYPVEGAAADRRWMPDFPGIAEVEDSADWEPGLPLDLDRIREKDETWWDEHRGTPKAFITRTGKVTWVMEYPS